MYFVLLLVIMKIMDKDGALKLNSDTDETCQYEQSRREKEYTKL